MFKTPPSPPISLPTCPLTFDSKREMRSEMMVAIKIVIQIHQHHRHLSIHFVAKCLAIQATARLLYASRLRLLAHAGPSHRRTYTAEPHFHTTFRGTHGAWKWKGKSLSPWQRKWKIESDNQIVYSYFKYYYSLTISCTCSMAQTENYGQREREFYYHCYTTTWPAE